MTVIIVPQPSRPTTKSRRYTATTPAGRQLDITITGAVDITDKALAADLKAALTDTTAATLAPAADDTPRGMLAFIGLWLLGWMAVILGHALLASNWGARTSKVESWVPFVGGMELPFQTMDLFFYSLMSSLALLLLTLALGLIASAFSKR
jgi:hypothetical protein